jgi:hypothetical protein
MLETYTTLMAHTTANLVEEHLRCLTTPLMMPSVDSFLIRDVLTLPSKAKRMDSIAGTESP